MKKLIIFILLIYSTICFAQKRAIQTGQPIPKKPINNIHCLDNSKTSVRLLSHEPHVPFAIVDGDTIKSAGQQCCEEWATTQHEWYNLNKLGKIVGKSVVETGEGYDISQCFELNLKTVSGQNGIGLFASKKIDWEVDSIQIWQPTIFEKEKFNTFLKNLNRLVIDKSQPNYVDTLSEGKMIFFQTSPKHEYIPNTKCVVFGKRFLVIAYLNNLGDWTLAHLENEYTNNEFKEFIPIALLDVNKDGIPEIVFQDNLGHIFWDKILKISNAETIDSWKIEAISVKGGKI